MPPDKVKLSPESKRTFLELGLEYVIKEQKSTSEEQKKSLMYNFVKMLCVKKSYLYCYYPVDPEFYRLILHSTQYTDSIRVSLASKKHYFSEDNHLYLTYDSVSKLIKLLLPSYIGASFSFGFNGASFKQYLELLKLTKGKIGLYLNWNLKKEFGKELLETFTDRIRVLFCHIDQFEAAERLQFLDYLSVFSISNSSQILRILKLETKKLDLRCFGKNFTIDDSDLIDLKNETVEKLYLDFESVNIEKLVKQLHKCCSSLKYFDIEANFHQRERSVNRVFERVVAYIKCINDLKACLENDLVSAKIYFNVSIRINGERENTWIKRICENLDFKHWEFDSDELVLKKILGGFEYHDILKMKFDNSSYKLEIAIDVITCDVDNQDQALEDGDSEDQASEEDDEDQISVDNESEDQASENEDMDVDE